MSHFIQGVPLCTVRPTLYSAPHFIQGLPLCTGCPTLYRVSHFIQCVPLYTGCPTLYSVSHFIHGVPLYTGCPTRYRTQRFFNNFATNEDIATTFEADVPHYVRNVTTSLYLLEVATIWVQTGLNTSSHILEIPCQYVRCHCRNFFGDVCFHGVRGSWFVLVKPPFQIST